MSRNWLRNLSARRDRTRNQATARRRPSLEGLEGRALMATTAFDPSTGVLIVTGTEVADRINISTSQTTNRTTVRIKSEGSDITTVWTSPVGSPVSRVEANGLGGADAIDASYGYVAPIVILNGGAGDDELYGSTGDDTINGGEGDDLLVGHAGNDSLNGDAGNDKINGNAGNDKISGGLGADVLSGHSGDDTINGDSGFDKIFAGEGNDVLNGGSNADEVFGEGGDDTITFDWYDYQDGELLYGGTGNNRLNLFLRNAYGTALQDIFNGDSANTLDDKINDFVLDPTNPSKQLRASTGGYVNTKDFSSAGVVTSVDFVVYKTKPSGDPVDAPTLPIGWIDITAAIGRIDSVIVMTPGVPVTKANYGDALNGNNVVIGTTSHDTISALGGNDLIFGRDGDDIIDAGQGNDIVYGGNGKDTIGLGSGNDVAFGGAGADTISFIWNSAQVAEVDGGNNTGDTLHVNFKDSGFTPTVTAEWNAYAANPNGQVLNITKAKSGAQKVRLFAVGFKAVMIDGTAPIV